MKNNRLCRNRPVGTLKSVPVSEAEFPTARYFQIHFEYLYETLAAMTLELAGMKDRIEGLESILQPEQAEAESERLEKYRNN